MPPKLPLEEILLKRKYKIKNPAVMYSWLEQMVAGYVASHPGSAFNDELQLYESKIEQAENDLHEMVFHQKD